MSKNFKVSKSQYVELCLRACRNDGMGESVYLDLNDGELLAECAADMSCCEALGTCDVYGYCDDIESDEAYEQVLQCFDANDDWKKIANDLEADVTIEWVD